MQKYNQYCPVSRATEILGDRWTLLIVREMMLGSHRFNEIERGLPGISRSLLASRLRNLVDAGIVERLPGARSKLPEYSLSETGRDLKKVIEALGAWGVRCAFGEPRPEELDAALLVWKIHQRINRDLLPQKRTVVEFDFTGPQPHRAWLVMQPWEVSVCVTPPGFDSDLVVRADLALFYRLWLGYVEYDVALRSGAVVVDGPPALAREFSRWLMWSPMSHFVRAHTRAAAIAGAAERRVI
jgi:DNA-binding HxlR family transcriptional regulator